METTASYCNIEHFNIKTTYYEISLYDQSLNATTLRHNDRYLADDIFKCDKPMTDPRVIGG